MLPNYLMTLFGTQDIIYLFIFFKHSTYYSIYLIFLWFTLCVFSCSLYIICINCFWTCFLYFILEFKDLGIWFTGFDVFCWPVHIAQSLVLWHEPLPFYYHYLNFSKQNYCLLFIRYYYCFVIKLFSFIMSFNIYFKIFFAY